MLLTASMLVGPQTAIAQDSAAGGWGLVATGDPLMSMSFPDADHGWAVGPNGTVVATTDGGATWALQRTGGGYIRAVAFADPQHGLAVGNSGLLLRTADGGKTWHTAVVPYTTDDLTGVAYRDSAHAYVTTFGGTFVTSDGGLTWQQDLRIAGELVAFGDADHGVILGTRSGQQGYYTRDGGTSWSEMRRPVGALSAVTAVDGTHFWVTGWGTVSASSDGGVTWVEQRVACGDLTATWRAVSFIDTQHGWISGDGGLCRTTDGGQTWESLPPSPYGVGEAQALVFVDDVHGWLSGPAGQIARTSDGGLTWSSGGYPLGIGASGAPATLRAVDFPDELHGWAVGDNGTILSTSDGGKTWAAQASRTTAHLAAVSFVDAQHGWVGGATDAFKSGVLLVTADGGRTWSVLGDTPAAIADVKFADANSGWMIADSQILATTDGGHTWMAQTLRTGGLRQLVLVDASHLWAVGHGGALATEDGSTWAERFPDRPSIYSVSSTKDGRNIWLTASFTSFRSEDGGRTWVRLAGRPGRERFADVRFADARHGWATGGSGTYGCCGISETFDGGATWYSTFSLKFPSPSGMTQFVEHQFYGIAVLDSGRVVAVGDAGTIVATPTPLIGITAHDDPVLVSGSVSAGGPFSTGWAGEVATRSNPLIVTVTSPNAGTVGIQRFRPGTSPGFRSLAPAARITAPDASVAKPLRLQFDAYVGDLPAGSYGTDVALFRDGALVSACSGSQQANPDPCVAASALERDPRRTLTVLSSRGGTWEFRASEVARLGGLDRFATAVLAAQAGFPTGSQPGMAPGSSNAVVLARADDYADALVGTPLAAVKNAPLLLTSGSKLPGATKVELKRLLSSGDFVYVLGGTPSIPDSVVNELKGMGYRVVRYGGVDRFATAEVVAQALGSPSTVFLATGVNFPDALAAGTAAAKTGGAVLLTHGTKVPGVTSTYLDTYAKTTYAVGGAAAAAVPKATALAGVDRYATSVLVAQRFFHDPVTIGVATGQNFPDALAAGPLLARSGSPLVLSAPASLPNSVASYLGTYKAADVTAHLFGAEASLSKAVQDGVQRALGR